MGKDRAVKLRKQRNINPGIFRPPGCGVPENKSAEPGERDANLKCLRSHNGIISYL